MTHINKLLGSDNLEEIQNLIPQNKRLKKIVSVNGDQSTWLHKELYKVDPYYDFTSKNPSKGKFIKLYDKFVNWLGNEYFSENLIYQRKPTIRVHLVGNMSVGGFHRDSEYNHPKDEFNVWVPLTLAINTSTIQVEKDYNKENYEPFNSDYGEFAIFDGCLKHGNEINIEDKTRVSFDFRVIRESEFRENNKRSLTQNIEFSLNNYYSKMCIKKKYK